MGYGGTDKYYNPDNKVVHDGETANASDLNNINSAVDVAFEQVADNLDAINTNANDKAELAEAWASNDQGDKPEASKDKYSSEANALEAQDWASRATGQTIRLADGTTSSTPSALAQVELAAAQVVLAEAAKTGAETAETNAETAQAAAELAETGAETAQTAAETAQGLAETAQAAAELAETGAEAAETSAISEASDAADSATESYHWAQYPEDSLVPEGNMVDEYSSYHWAEKAAAIVAGNHTIASHIDTTATGGQLNTLVGGGDTTLHKHDSQYYTETESDAALALKSDATHTHDDRYYTETESDAALALKSDATHSHTVFSTDMSFTKNILMGEDSGVNANYLKMGYLRTGDGYCYIDFSGEAGGTLGLRMLRNAGINASTTFEHFGTGNFEMRTKDAAHLAFYTDDVLRGWFGGTTGKLTLQTGAGVNEFSVDGTLVGDSDDAVPTEKAVKTYVDTQVTPHPLGNLLINPEFLANTRDYLSGAVIATDSYFYDMWQSVGSLAQLFTNAPHKTITLVGSIKQTNKNISSVEEATSVTVSANVTSGSLDVSMAGSATSTQTLAGGQDSATFSFEASSLPTGLITLAKNGATACSFKGLKAEVGTESTDFEETTKTEEFYKGAPYLVDQGYSEINNPIVVKSSDVCSVEQMTHVDVGLTTTSSMVSGASTIVGFNSEVEDVLDEFTTGSSARFTANHDGYYLINMATLLTSASWGAGEFCFVELYKNGTAHDRGQRVIQGVASTGSIAVGLDYSSVIKLDEDDYIEVKVYHNQGSSINLQADYLHTHMTIDRIL